MRPFLLIAFSFLVFLAHAQNLPSPFMDTFKSKGLDKKYSLSGFLQPNYLQADFNGDGAGDVAVLVVEKVNKKKGILLIHVKSGEHYVFGAGNKIDDSENFTWADKWAVYKKKTAYETQFDKASGDIIGGKEVRLARPGILIEDYEDGAALAGGIIYWNGKKYIWIHQGE